MEKIILRPANDSELLLIKEFIENTHIKSNPEPNTFGLRNRRRKMILHIKYKSALLDFEIINKELLFWISNAKLDYGIVILEYYKLENKTSEVRDTDHAVESSFIVIVGKTRYDIEKIREFASNCPRLNEYSGFVEIYELYPED